MTITSGARIFTSARLNRLAVAILLGIIFALIPARLADKDHSGLLTRGDFPAFYAAAVILVQGDFTHLYNGKLQHQIENSLWPSFKGNFYMFVYPPGTALVLLPLAWFTPQVALLLLTLVSLACLIGTHSLIMKMRPDLAKYELFIFALMLSFPPIFYSVFGSQNTALSMLLYAGYVYFLLQDSARAKFLAGISLGLWLYKPQLALPVFMLTLPLLGRHTLAGFFSMAIVWYFMGVYVMGFDWPLTWPQAALSFGEENHIANQREMVSLVGSLKAFLYWLQTPWEIASNVSLVAHGLCIGIVAWAFWLAIKARKNKDKELIRYSLLLAGPLTVLINPQTLFYDLGISLFPLVFCLRVLDRNIFMLILGWLALLPITYFRESFPVPPLLLLAIGFAFFVMQQRQNHSIPMSATEVV